MKVICRYLNLTEIPPPFDIEAYQKYVKPLDYEFGLVRNRVYLVIGFIERKGTLWTYSLEEGGDYDLDLTTVPAVLFHFNAVAFSPDMVARHIETRGPALEILPKKLAAVENWFERYIDEEEEIVKLVVSEIKRIRDWTP